MFLIQYFSSIISKINRKIFSQEIDVISHCSTKHHEQIQTVPFKTAVANFVFERHKDDYNLGQTC